MMDSPGWGLAGLVLAVLILFGVLPGQVLAWYLIIVFILNYIDALQQTKAEEKR
jgi:uncharacterized protein (DUF58 family)